MRRVYAYFENKSTQTEASRSIFVLDATIQEAKKFLEEIN